MIDDLHSLISVMAAIRCEMQEKNAFPIELEAYDKTLEVLNNYNYITVLYDAWNVDFGVDSFRTLQNIGRVLNNSPFRKEK